jgi:hypothetical protein
VIQQPRRSTTPPPAHPSSPLPRASPSPGVDGAIRGVLQELSPRPPASPSSGVAGRDGRLAGHHLPGSRPIHTPAPSWASIVRDGARAKTTAVSRHDFLTLYERCIDSGLRTRLIFRHQAGSNEISISCRLSAPPADAYAPAKVRRRRRRRKRAPAAAVINSSPPPDSGPSHQTAPSPPTTAPRETPPPAEAATPPAKRTRKAARRRCEVELLRGNDTDDDNDDDLHLSPALQARQTTPIDSDPISAAQPTPDSSPTTPTSKTPATPSLQAVSPAGQLPPPSPPTTPPDREEPTCAPAGPRAPAGPPPPPPWSDAFSTDPDRIICRKCSKRSYVFRWYSHCYLCHINESKT